MDVSVPFGVFMSQPEALARASTLKPQAIHVDFYSQVVADSGWAALDRLVSSILARGIRIVGILNGPAGWGHWDTREQRIEWAAWASECVSRYAGRVIAWRVGNEPNNRGWLGRSGMPVAKYADLLRRTSIAIRRQDSKAWVITAGISPVADGDTTRPPATSYVADLYREGVLGCFDALAFHVYSGTVLAPDAGTWKTMLRVRDVMVDAGDAGTKIWITECGASTVGPSAATEAFQADFLRSVIKNRPAWVGRISQYTAVDCPELFNAAVSLQGGFGAIRADGSDKPVANVIHKN